MSALGKKIGKAAGKQAINNRYKWVEFIAAPNEEEGEDFEPYLIRCRVRTSLAHVEIQQLLEFEGKNEELFKFVAPYVVEWDVTWVQDGDLFAVQAPAVVGWEAFNYAPNGLAYAIINSLTSEAFSKVDPKSLKPAENTDSPTSDQ